MKASILQFKEGKWFPHPERQTEEPFKGELVLCFASKSMLQTPGIFEIVRGKFPSSEIALCSTAGEIFHNIVQDNSFVAVVLHFEKTVLRTASVNVAEFDNSYEAAVSLVKKLPSRNLSYILVLSDGSMVNGSELVKGLNDAASNKILITGGLAGDGADFSFTLVGLNQTPGQGNIVAIGLYGEQIVVTHGSQGGWETFGPERTVTRSAGNVLFEIDNKCALEVYKRYLGPDADKLPGSALLFPLSVIAPDAFHSIVRTILSIDNENNSMTFAGDIPVGSKVRLMKANFDKLTLAASRAAQHCISKEGVKPVFSLLVSCVGRKLILGSRTEEEVEAVQETLGNQTVLAGFYSYGEISPFNKGGNCQLHNQTMTITSFYEI